MKRELIADTHIHIYENYNIEQFISNGLANAGKFSSEEAVKLLCLTEAKENRFFKKFSDGETCGSYSFSKTEEDFSLKIIKDNKTEGYLLNGRQIVTSEGIEVLALATSEIIEDGKPASEVIDSLISKGAVVVLGWGVGKWLFGRGNLVNQLIDKYSASQIIIGDNSARPPFWGTPVQFLKGGEKGIKIVAGSDPLPFSEEINKPGTYNIVGTTEFNENTPGSSLNNLITSGDYKICGKRDSIAEFFTRQLRMYTKKYLGK